MTRAANTQHKREEIAEAAWRVIEREGPQGASVRGIAREASYTTGVLSHYFRDKQELMTFAFELMVDRSTARIAQTAAESGPVEALAEFLPLDEERRREAKLWLVLIGASLADAALAEELGEHYRQAREAMWPVLSGALESAPEESPEDLADELLAVVDGITVDALTDPKRYPPERQMVLLRRAVARFGISMRAS